MRILITGSEGTLGPILRAELESREHEVTGCDTAHSYRERYMRTDVAEWRQVERLFKIRGPFDVTYHLAAEFGRNNGAEYPEQLWKTNQIGTRNVIDACLHHGSRLILAGSSEAYGESTTYNDSDTVPLHESLLDKYAPAFHNEYALSKWTQERQVFIAAQNGKLPAIVLRFFNAYGPGEYYSPYRSVVCLFCYRLMFGLPVTVYRNYHRVFQFVGDWARTVANVAERFDTLHRGLGKWHGSRPASVPVYNIGGREYRSVEEMAQVVLNAIGGPDGSGLVKYIDKEAANVTNKMPDIALAEHDLAHDPRVTLEEGVPRTIEWMRRVYDANGIPFDAGRTESFAFGDFDATGAAQAFAEAARCVR